MGLWAKLHTDILDDPKLIRAARLGARELELLPWLIAFAKRADDGGRLSVSGVPAEAIDIARSIPGVTAKRVATCISWLETLGILTQDEGFPRFSQWEKRSGHIKTKPSDTPERVRERVSRHRQKAQAVDAPHSSNGVTPPVTPLVTPGVTLRKHPLDVDVDVDVERDKERRAESVTPRVTASARDEPGSAAALVAPLPNCEEPEQEGANEPGGGMEPPASSRDLLAPALPETPAQSPNGTAPPADGRSAPRVSSAINGVDTPALDSLPVAAVKLLRTFYPRGKATDARRLDVFEQMQQLLKPEGLAFNGGVIRVTPARLSGACLAVLKAHTKTPLEDPDAALPYLLTKLSDVSQDSPTEKAAVAAKVEELRDRETFAERQARADKIAGEYPDEDQRLREAAKRIFPGKDKEMAQPRESYRVSQLLALHIEVPS